MPISFSPFARVKFYTSAVLITLLLFGLIFSSTGRAQALPEEWPAKIKAAIDNTPPYRIINGDEISGIYVDIYELVMQQLEMETEFVEVPYPRAFHLLENGDVDVMLGPIKTEDRTHYIDFSIPAFPPVTKVFLVKDQRNAVTQYSDLQKKVIGVQRAANYFVKFDEDTSLTKFEVKDYTQALNMLEAGRVDVVIIPAPVADELLPQLGLSFIRSPMVVPGSECYIAIGKSSPLRFYIPRIKQSLKQIKESGEYRQIVARYMN